MQTVTTIGLDLAKSVLQVHGVDREGVVVIRRALRRSQVLDFFRRLPPCLVGLEACSSSHYWAREIVAFGHQVRMIPPIYVKAYVKRGKTDTADAEAICEAVTRPTMRFVPIKDVEQQAAGMLLRTRDLLVRQRSQLANAFRAQMSELGIISALGMASIAKLADKVRDPDVPLPPVARLALLEMAEQIDVLSDRIERLGQEIQVGVKADETARRLTSIPGVGPLIAATVRATVNDIAGFKTGRDFAAWLGLTPRLLSSGDLQTGESPAQGPAGCRRLVDHQTSETRRPLAGMAHRADGSQALQTCRGSACEQDRSDHLGLACQGRLLQESGSDPGGGLTDHEFSASTAETGAKVQAEG
jgi:transposase